MLSTKVGRTLSPLPPGAPRPGGYRDGGLPFAPTYDYSYDGTMRSIEDSYQRLGLPSIDVVFIHDVDLYTHKDQDLVDRYFGEAMEGALSHWMSCEGRVTFAPSAAASTTRFPVPVFFAPGISTA